MVGKPIAETSLAGLRPTGVDGRRVLEAWEQIDSYLRGGPGEDLAELFAEPVLQSQGRVIWFAPEAASVRLFRELPPDGQEALRAALAARLARLDEEVRRLLASSNPAARFIGEVLERAQQVPGAVEDVLYSVDGRPVLINWSLEPEGAPPPKQPLKEFARPPAPPPPRIPAPAAPPPSAVAAIPAAPIPPAPVPPTEMPVVVVVRRRMQPWWGLWVLAVLLFSAIFYVLLIGCGFWANGQLANFCPVPPVAAALPPDPEAKRTDALRSELAQLEQRLNRVPRCPEPAQPAPVPAPAPSTTAEFDRRVERSGAAEGDLTVTLIWSTRDDLDLIVRCPSGELVSFLQPEMCGGRLDVDANFRTIMPNPVENIYFARGSWKPGTYTVLVKNASVPPRQIPFQVRIKKGGETIIRQGATTTGDAVSVIDVTMP